MTAPTTPSTPTVAIIRTGSANLASVRAAFARLGCESLVTQDPEIVRRAPLVVLPGVGAFAPAMQQLRASALDTAIADRVRDGLPLLAICLGLQLLCARSEESPGVAGLGIVSSGVTRFAAASAQRPLRIPQMGWNQITPTPNSRHLAPVHMYFANSYRLKHLPEGWQGAIAQHAGPFVAALERGSLLACQFHPELSGQAGLDMLRQWLLRCGAALPTPHSPALPAPLAPSERGVPQGLARRIIPCLDVRDGRVVKGVRFANLRDSGDPAELAARYEVQGADEITLLDVSATPEARATAVDTVARVRRALSIPLTVGGGVRTINDAARLLDAGADKVGINTAAVDRPRLITECAARFGTQCIVVAIDAASIPPSPDSGSAEWGEGRVRGVQPTSTSAAPDSPRWIVRVRSGSQGTALDAVAWARQAADLGAGEILLTSWDRDGTRSGYDLPLLGAVAGAVTIPVIASGGAARPHHLLEALTAGADAVLAASIFHDGEFTVGDAKLYLADRGIAIRPAWACPASEPRS